MDASVHGQTTSSATYQTQSQIIKHDSTTESTSDQENDIHPIPSPQALDSVSCKTCSRNTLRVVTSPHTKALAGGLIIYGLATWWVGGSGLIIAGIGAAIWFVSTIGSVYIKYQMVRDALNRGAHIAPISETLSREIACSVGWATPLGWIALVVHDACTVVGQCVKFLSEACDVDYD